MSRSIKPGDQVVASGSGLVGLVKWVGKLPFIRGDSEWVGLELPQPDGKNDGKVKGTRFFTCKPNHGLFVKLETVTRLKDPSYRSSGKSMTRSKSSSKNLSVGNINEDIMKACVDYENHFFLRTLIEEDNQSPHGADAAGNTPLHAVAVAGGGKKAIATLEYLLNDCSLWPLLHHKNMVGDTPVMDAARKHNWKVMQYLIEVGSDVICKGHDGSLPSVWDSCRNIAAGMRAMHAGMETQRKRREKKQLNVRRMTHKYGDLVDAYFKVAMAGDKKYVRMLLEERGLNAAAMDDKENTVLHMIANNYQRLTLIKYVIALGCPVDTRNKVGDTPCLIAARSQTWPVMQLLISQGASVTNKDEKTKKSVKDHANVRLLGRKALQSGLVQKMKNRLTHIAPEHDDDDDNDYDEEEIQHQAEEEMGDSFDDVPPPPDDEEEQERLASKVEAAASAAASGSTIGAGTFGGVVTGKKKDRNKSKECTVHVTEPSLLVEYTKESWFRKKKLVDEYVWNDKMKLERPGNSEDTLVVYLDSAQNVQLTIYPCQASVLEEFIWKSIWKCVFEVSFQEVSGLLDEYDSYCTKTQEDLREHMNLVDELGDPSQLSSEEEMQLADIKQGINDLCGRFSGINNQGSVLHETFESMREALERRNAAEEARKNEFSEQGDYARANAVKDDQEHIQEQLGRVQQYEARVKKLFEDMKQLQVEVAEKFSGIMDDEQW